MKLLDAIRSKELQTKTRSSKKMKIRILKSTIAPKLSELAMNTYSLPCKGDKNETESQKCIRGMLPHYKIYECVVVPTLDNNASSFPLFFNDGNTSPWPGGYLHEINGQEHKGIRHHPN